MHNSVSEQAKTRERILSAATDVFTEHGFQKTTIREICARAGVNVAAVNYHFGSKENLYKEVCLRALGLSDRAPRHGQDLPSSAPPQQQLERFIRSFLFEVLDQSKQPFAGKIMVWEMREPSGVFEFIIDEVIKPHHERLCDIVSAILGPGADVETVKQCVFSIVGQCLHYRYGRKTMQRLYPDLPLTPEGIDRIASHITRFSLAALRGIAAELKQME